MTTLPQPKQNRPTSKRILVLAAIALVLLSLALVMWRRGQESPSTSLVPLSENAISPQNVGRVTLLASLDIDGFGPAVYSPDGQLLATAFSGGVLILDAKTLQTRAVLEIEDVRSLSFSPDGELLATGERKKFRVSLWQISGCNDSSVKCGELLRTLTQLEKFYSRRDVGVGSMAFAPDGELLATGVHGTGVGVFLWRVSGCGLDPFGPECGEIVQTIYSPEYVYGLDFSPDGELLASASFDESSTLSLWRVAGCAHGPLQACGELVRERDMENSWMYSVDFSPDGKSLAFGSYLSLCLWRVSDGKLLRTLDSAVSWVISVDFSPDGALLASAGNTEGQESQVYLWRVSDGELLQGLAHPDGVRSVAFSPDGETLVSTGGDRVLRLWGIED